MQKRLFCLCLVIMLLSGCNKTCVIGDPDCVSSSSINEELYLTIVANKTEIEDTKVFAKEILEICKNNSFKSIRLSTDIQGFPEKITAEIYLSEEEIEKKEPVLVIEYTFSTETNIVDITITTIQDSIGHSTEKQNRCLEGVKNLVSMGNEISG